MRIFPQGVILIGLGALGSHAADLLIRMGVRVWLVDPDTVEEENLPQSLYYPHEIGMPKARVICVRHGLPQEHCLIAYAEDVLHLLPQDVPIIIMTDSRESRLSILTRLDASRDVWSLAVSLRQGEVLHTTTERLIRLLEGKRGFACRSRILPIVLPRLTATLFAHAAYTLRVHELVRLSLTENGVRVSKHQIGIVP